MSVARPFFTVLFIGLLSVCLAACSLLGSDTETPGTLLPFETLLQSQEFVEADEQTFVILRSRDEEAAFLSDYEPSEPFPEVDYSKEVVVGLLTGRRPNSSYSVTIDSLVATSETVRAYATESGSATGYQVITHPAHFVRLGQRELRGRTIELADVRRICERSLCAWE